MGEPRTKAAKTVSENKLRLEGPLSTRLRPVYALEAPPPLLTIPHQDMGSYHGTDSISSWSPGVLTP